MKEFYEPKELLPDWGPYSKKYMGISRILSEALVSGARFDCVVHPMLANANQPAPNVTFPSSYHVWEAAPDLSYFSYRVEMEWKDQVYADVSFSRIDEKTRLIRTEYVNNTELDQNCVLNYYLAMEYPWKQIAEISCAGAFAWKKMTDYDAMEHHTPRPWEHLMPDGLHRGEFFDPQFVEGRGFGDRAQGSEKALTKGKAFGEEKGDLVRMSLSAKETFDTLCIRYRTLSEEGAEFLLTVQGEGGKECLSRRIAFPASDELSVIEIPVELAEEERHCPEEEGTENGREKTVNGDSGQTKKLSLTLVSEGKGGVEFDFAALHHRETPVRVEMTRPEFMPDCKKAGKGWLLTYEGVKETFGFQPLSEDLRIRDIPTGTLEDALVSRLSQADPTFDHVTETFTSAFTEKHSDDGFYKNYIVHSIFIPAGERHVEYALVGDGEQKTMTAAEAEKHYHRSREGIRDLNYNRDGEDYIFSNRMLQATLLTNVVYPIYRHGEWIKHHTPGKRWDSLYTWDSGFIGMGLLECESSLAEYILDLYLSNEENQDFAFLMHGSPVPVQAYLYLELLQRSGNKEKLFSWYPRLKRYYSFLAGKSEGSTTDPFASRMTTTFDYFYNCSGMDDLPPQMAMYEQKKQEDCAPALTTSQLIRMAKILRMAAMEQGLTGDAEEYEKDIALRQNALQTFAWDEKSGYFGYVVHDKEKKPLGIFKTDSGENLSKGMDGIYPLIAGICTEEQEERILRHIFSEKEMFSRVGISAVDMSAGYYQPNGYWNGNVWFSHQWFIWKTMFDLGRSEEAYRIAKTALDSWKREVDHSYYTFEMLNIATARGGWFHQFGGLSAPVNIWANAYYRPGTVTCGFDLWIREQHYDAEEDTFRIVLTNYGKRPGLLLAVLKDGAEGKVKAYLNGEEIPVCCRTEGAAEVMIPEGVKEGEIIVK